MKDSEESWGGYLFSILVFFLASFIALVVWLLTPILWLYEKISRKFERFYLLLAVESGIYDNIEILLSHNPIVFP